MAIRGFHNSNKEGHRNVCIIPTSAHGTNPASAVMAGMKVVTTGVDSKGNIDMAQLRKKAEEHKDKLVPLLSSCFLVLLISLPFQRKHL